jgi:hypothetical protein
LTLHQWGINGICLGGLRYRASEADSAAIRATGFVFCPAGGITGVGGDKQILDSPGSLGARRTAACLAAEGFTGWKSVSACTAKPATARRPVSPRLGGGH